MKSKKSEPAEKGPPSTVATVEDDFQGDGKERIQNEVQGWPEGRKKEWSEMKKAWRGASHKQGKEG